jgi:hypothetical protein
MRPVILAAVPIAAATEIEEEAVMVVVPEEEEVMMVVTAEEEVVVVMMVAEGEEAAVAVMAPTAVPVLNEGESAYPLGDHRTIAGSLSGLRRAPGMGGICG